MGSLFGAAIITFRIDSILTIPSSPYADMAKTAGFAPPDRALAYSCSRHYPQGVCSCKPPHLAQPDRVRAQRQRLEHVGAPPDPAVNPDLDRVPQPLLGQRLDDGAGVSLQLQRGLSIVMQTVGHKQILHVGIAAVGHGSP